MDRKPKPGYKRQLKTIDQQANWDRRKHWDNLQDETKRKVLEAVIHEQEVHNEMLTLSAAKHYITPSIFNSTIEQYPDLMKKWELAKFKIDNNTDIQLIKTSLSTVEELLKRSQLEQIDYVWDKKEGKWIPKAKRVTSNAAQQERIAKYILERLLPSFNNNLKQIKVTAALDILKQFTTKQDITEGEIEGIRSVMANYLRENGIEVVDDDIDNINIIDYEDEE